VKDETNPVVLGHGTQHLAHGNTDTWLSTLSRCLHLISSGGHAPKGHPERCSRRHNEASAGVEGRGSTCGSQPPAICCGVSPSAGQGTGHGHCPGMHPQVLDKVRRDRLSRAGAGPNGPLESLAGPGPAGPAVVAPRQLID
jgi:hypothetical protein